LELPSIEYARQRVFGRQPYPQKQMCPSESSAVVLYELAERRRQLSEHRIAPVCEKLARAIDGMTVFENDLKYA